MMRGFLFFGTWGFASTLATPSQESPELRGMSYSPEGEFALEEGLLCGGGVGASAVDEGRLEAGEGDLINEPFTAAGAGGFPSYEHLLGDKPPYACGGVAERHRSLLHRNTTGHLQPLMFILCLHTQHHITPPPPCQVNGQRKLRFTNDEVRIFIENRRA